MPPAFPAEPPQYWASARGAIGRQPLADRLAVALVALAAVVFAALVAFVVLATAWVDLGADALAVVAFAAAFDGAALLAGALATAAVVFLVERAVVVAGAAFTAAEALRPRPPAAALAVEALAVGAFTARVARPATPAAARPLAGALLAAAFLAAAFLPAAFLALRAALKPAAGLKRMPFEAAILTGCPVRGLRPVRAFLDVALKLPKP
jgi:hypothetical protein